MGPPVGSKDRFTLSPRFSRWSASNFDLTVLPEPSSPSMTIILPAGFSMPRLQEIEVSYLNDQRAARKAGQSRTLTPVLAAGTGLRAHRFLLMFRFACNRAATVRMKL